MVKAIVVIAPKNFQDYEFLQTIEELKKAGVEVEIISTIKGKCIGVGGSVVEAKTISDIKTNEFDSLVFIDGSGTPVVRADKKMIALAEKFFMDGKIIGAICFAPTILAKAGILKGKQATVWIGFDPEYSKTTDYVLREAGAILMNLPVVEDKTIITANGPPAARAFGKKLAEKIKR
ncbi:MAG: DJ-1/PfpI family protein [Candidatus Micrarchaeota archaeon]